MEKLKTVDGRGHEHAARVPVTRDRARDVDEVHHRAAKDEAKWIGVVRQHDLHHFGVGI